MIKQFLLLLFLNHLFILFFEGHIAGNDLSCYCTRKTCVRLV